MRRREPWYLFCGDAHFARQQLLRELTETSDHSTRASLLQLLGQLGAWDALEEQLQRQPALLLHADGRAALLRLRQHQQHPNPWLALLPESQQEPFMAFCQTLLQGDGAIEVRLSGGLGDQLEALALMSAVHGQGPLRGRLKLAIPASSQRALEPLLALAQPANLLPSHVFGERPADLGPPWLGLLPMRALLAANTLERPPAVLWGHWRQPLPSRQLVVCWRSKVDPRERFWAHLRSLPWGEIQQLYRWLLPWAAERQWQVVDITQYRPEEQQALARLPKATQLTLAQPALVSLADTAQLVAEAALVVSVDTALMHLAHGLAVPRRLLLHRHPDARWRQRLQQDGCSDREGLRVLQQTIQGQWQGPLRQLQAHLAQLEA